MRARLSTPTTPPILHPLFQRGHLHIKSENLPSVAKISLTIVSKNKNDFFFHICCKALIVKLYFIFATEGSDIFESFRCWQASHKGLPLVV